ncbi:MAG: PAS domain S-box protein [Proteobacteria bacterium]|nr:PAS domain S-box protein [Pseudomonadota bacterium]
MKKLKILNLEDSPNDSELIEEILSEAGIECEIILTDTEEGFISEIEKGCVDIILADYTLPSFDGFSALDIALKKCPEAPFIFVTGTLGEEIAVESLKRGATDYVLKDRLMRLVPSIQRALKEAEFKKEQKRKDDELRESEENFRELVENINDAFFLADDKGIITYISNPVESFWGYKPSEIIGRPFHELIYTEDLYIVEKEFENKISGYRKPIEFRLTKKTGEIIWVRSSGRYIMQENTIIGSRGLLINITESKKSEAKLKDSFERLQKATSGIIQAMTLTIETRDPYTAGHQRRVAALARAIAIEMNLPVLKVEGIDMAGSIHDLGKLSVPADILSKPSKLNEIEMQLIQIHPEAGYNILKDIDFPWPVAQIILQHHERMNGSGYPKGLKGEEILIETRILSVADVVEAMASHRPYRPSMGIGKALEEIKENENILYDPAVVSACLRVFKENKFEFDKPCNNN